MTIEQLNELTKRQDELIESQNKMKEEVQQDVDQRFLIFTGEVRNQISPLNFQNQIDQISMEIDRISMDTQEIREALQNRSTELSIQEISDMLKKLEWEMRGMRKRLEQLHNGPRQETQQNQQGQLPRQNQQTNGNSSHPNRSQFVYYPDQFESKQTFSGEQNEPSTSTKTPPVIKIEELTGITQKTQNLPRKKGNSDKAHANSKNTSHIVVEMNDNDDAKSIDIAINSNSVKENENKPIKGKQQIQVEKRTNVGQQIQVKKPIEGKQRIQAEEQFEIGERQVQGQIEIKGARTKCCVLQNMKSILIDEKAEGDMREEADKKLEDLKAANNKLKQMAIFIKEKVNTESKLACFNINNEMSQLANLAGSVDSAMEMLNYIIITIHITGMGDNLESLIEEIILSIETCSRESGDAAIAILLVLIDIAKETITYSYKEQLEDLRKRIANGKDGAFTMEQISEFIILIKEIMQNHSKLD
jgi:hypothetical protein